MARKSVTDRSLRAIKTRKKLFLSAAKLIDRYGYDNVTVEKICQKAGVSVGAFYHYYSSKTDIIVEFFKQIDYYYEERVEPELSGDAAADIETFFFHYAKFHVDQGYDHTSMMVKIQSDFFLDKTRYMHVKLIELVENAKADNVFDKEADAALIADYLLVVARGLLFDWSLARGEHDLIEKMKAYIKLAILSFKPSFYFTSRV